MTNTQPAAVVIGGGFTGLSAAWELTRAGHAVTVLEADATLGGLGGGFTVGDTTLERFYHHWFRSDRNIIELIEELGAGDRVLFRPTRTGMYYANSFHRLSTPLDVLRFKPLGLIDRVRLGLLVLKARAVSDWRQLEGLSVKDWLIGLAGPEVYRVVWEPLMIGKFGHYAGDISAVWMWNKLKLRGGSRGKGGGEELAYFHGGFQSLADLIGASIEAQGGVIRRTTPATGLRIENGRVTAVETPHGPIPADVVIATPALPLIADLVAGHVPDDYADGLRRIEYLANVCLVLELDRSLSDTYWLNVNDPGFPFVAVIEHTNFEPASSYAGRHIVYLSKYTPADSAIYRMSTDELLAFAIPHIARMFPRFEPGWVKRQHAWHARYAQPIVAKHYSALNPPRETPLANLFIASMAQIYPEDRGTNYAVREGRKIGRELGRR